MNISRNEILKLIKEVKNGIKEATPVTPPATPAPTAQPAAGQTPAPAATTATAAPVAFPAAALPALQGFSDMLFTSKHPQYAALKPWLQSLGVKVK